MDYYEVLKVSFSATEEEIKQSYRSLVLLLHPDKNPGRDTTKEFQMLMEAYTILKDPIKRREYDFQRSRTSSGPVPINVNTGSRASVDPMFFSSLFEDPFFREHESFFRSFFNHTSTFSPATTPQPPPPTQQHHPHPPFHPQAHYNPRHSFHAGFHPPSMGMPMGMGMGMPGMQSVPPPGLHPFAFHMEAMRRHEQMMQQFMGMSAFNPFGVYAAPEELQSVGSRRTRGSQEQETMMNPMGSAPKRASTGFTSVHTG